MPDLVVPLGMWVYGTDTSESRSGRVAPVPGYALEMRRTIVRTRDMRARPAPTSIVFETILETDPHFSVTVSRRSGHRVVSIGGELDVATRNRVRRACLGGRRDVDVEMADTTFMDCSGYGALVAARRVLQSHGGSLTLHNQVGQPAELLAMLSRLESCN